MNPKIVINVDTTKATATITGMLTVGAKVDVDVVGISESSVPLYGNDDKFVGRSLRLRIVDEMGKDMARYPLVEKDTSTTPVTENDKWTVTNNVFSNASGRVFDMDTDKLRRAFDCIPFNDKLEFGIILDSIVDNAQYAIGKVKVSQWSVASTEDPTVLPDWRETLSKLSDDLDAVETAKTAAAASSASAQGYASSASSSASSASGSAAAASTSASNAASSAASASDSAAASASAITHYPKVDPTTRHWLLWDGYVWVDSGIDARGLPGVPASVIQVRNPVTEKWHAMYARQDSAGNYVLSMEQTEAERSMDFIVPEGGTTDQVLSKKSNVDFDVEWKTAGAGDVVGAVMNGVNVGKNTGYLQLGTVLTDSSAFAPSSHVSDSTVHVTASEKTGWNGKATQDDITSAVGVVSGNLSTHTSDTSVHVTSAEKSTWGSKLDNPSTSANTPKYLKRTVTDGAASITWADGGEPANYLTSSSVSNNTLTISNNSGANPTSVTYSTLGAAASSHTHAQSEITDLTTALNGKIPTSAKGAANGVASLDASGKVLSTQLPSYVDDVLEVVSHSALPQNGESGKIYVTLNDNKTYRWSGSTYVEISASLALGESDSTAYRGDRGKTAYDHVSSTSNPHSVTAAQVGAPTIVNSSFTGIAVVTSEPQSPTNGVIYFITES